VGSFKVKLVAYFLLLSLLPLAAAFWGFSTVASQSEARRVDARLQAGLRATLAAYQEALGSADKAAERLARQPSFQRALLAHDRAALQRMLAGQPHLAVVAPGGFHVGKPDPRAPARRVAVVGAGGTQGAVIASVPLDGDLVKRLEARSGLEKADHVLVVEDGRIVAGPPGIRGRFDLLSGKPGTVSVGGTRYRALVAGTLEGRPSAAPGVISPQRLIDAANREARKQLLIGLIAALVFVGCVAYVEGRSIVRTIRRLVDAAAAIARGDLKERVPVQGRDEFALLGRTFNQMAFQLQTRLEELEAERGRLRDVTSRFSEALGATHDAEQLMPLILEAAMEATSAAGGVLVGTNGSLVKAGFPDKGPERLEVPLQAGSVSFGSLLLFGAEFSDEDRLTAISLASHAVVALDNARLHRIVERQALVDGLTGIANRRQCEETLEDELARVERFGGSLAVVVADLDWFKDVNDRHGHPAGDAVLREFAVLLEETVRDVDLAGRWGGEEFVLVLPGTDLAGGAQLAERIRVALAGRTVLAVDGSPIPVTASFGVAAIPPAKTASELFAAADAAMYQAKRAGKNRVEAAREPVSHS
jgi:diguanylate cyclase (GGDEF)-like protein